MGLGDDVKEIQKKFYPAVLTGEISPNYALVTAPAPDQTFTVLSLAFTAVISSLHLFRRFFSRSYVVSNEGTVRIVH